MITAADNDQKVDYNWLQLEKAGRAVETYISTFLSIFNTRAETGNENYDYLMLMTMMIQNDGDHH